MQTQLSYFLGRAWESDHITYCDDQLQWKNTSNYTTLIKVGKQYGTFVTCFNKKAPNTPNPKQHNKTLTPMLTLLYKTHQVRAASDHASNLERCSIKHGSYFYRHSLLSVSHTVIRINHKQEHKTSEHLIQHSNTETLLDFLDCIILQYKNLKENQGACIKNSQGNSSSV